MQRLVETYKRLTLGFLLWICLSGFIFPQPIRGILLQAVRSAERSLPSEYAALHYEGYPFTIFYDLDGDGMEDLFLLSVKKTDVPPITDVKALTEYSRVFDPKSVQRYAVHIFLRRHHTSTLLRTIELGNHRGLGSFRWFEIRHAARIPFGIEVTFPTMLGLERVWILVSASNRFELFAFKEQHSVKSYKRDINEDGILDLILFEGLFEDSFGFETYATWHQWEGNTFKRYRSVNIIRNLRKFLATMERHLLAKNWEVFFQFALTPKDASFAIATGPQGVFLKIFRALPPPLYMFNAVETPAIGIEILEKQFLDIVFPTIHENPFNIREEGPESFILPLRLVLEGESVILSARVALYRNFFEGRLFHLVLQ